MNHSVRNGKKILLISVTAFLFYTIAFVFLRDVYTYPLVGAIYELFSIPMLMILVVIPIISLLGVFGKIHLSRNYAVLSFLFIAGSIAILIKFG